MIKNPTGGGRFSDFRGEEQTTGSGWGNSTAGKQEKQDVGIDSYLLSPNTSGWRQEEGVRRHVLIQYLAPDSCLLTRPS